MSKTVFVYNKNTKGMLLVMQIFEVKNDTAKVLYNCKEENLTLFDFLFIEDEEQTIISQVITISSTDNENRNIATIKFHLSVDGNNRLTKYNGHIPQKNSEVGYLNAEEIIGLFQPRTNPVIWGGYAKNTNIQIETDYKFLSSGFCIICDRAEQNEIIVKTIISSLEKAKTRTLILDFDGKYQNIKMQNQAVYGKDYRIPLDSYALDYIFENDLNDCSPDSKIVIQNIILEIQKYIESVEKGFIPFEMFLQIIMNEAKRTANKGLLTFCNKLLTYKYKKIFADKETQFSKINDSDGSFKLDLSSVDAKFYNLIFTSVISGLYKKFYVITEITDENTDSLTLKNIYDKQNIRLIPIISHGNKNLKKITSHCNNLAIFASREECTKSEDYSIYAEKLKPDEFILYGENTLFVPLLVTIKNQMTKSNVNDDEITVADLDDLDKANLELVKRMIKEEQLKKEALTLSEKDLNDLEEIYNPLSFVQEKFNSKNKIENTKSQNDVYLSLDKTKEIKETETIEKNPTQKEEIAPIKNILEPQLSEMKNETEEYTKTIEEKSETIKEAIEQSIISEPEEDIVEGTEELVVTEPEEDIIERTEELVITEPEEDIVEGTEELVVTEPDEDIVEETDGTIPKEEEPEKSSNITKEEEQSLNIQQEQIEAENKPKPIEIKIAQQEHQQKESQRQIPKASDIPIYEPKIEPSKPEQEINYTEGMRISHAKYGAGTIEKIIKYGKKTLCSIQFDNVGRRLLDPNITTLERM